jgi:DNA repair protein RadA/Sms
LAKSKTVYTCTECGGTSPKWAGQCPHCQQWNTLVETVAQPTSGAGARFQSLASSATVRKLSDIDAVDVPRFSSGIDEFDRVLYVSGEESGAQIALRARRLGIESPNLALLAEIQLERIQATIEIEKPEVVVIDSIQTLYSEALTSAPGSVAQVRECAAQLTRIAKRLDVTTILVGHVTKEGALAGPRVLEHIVDTVLYFVSQHEQVVPGSCVLVTQEGTRPLLVEIQALVDTANVPNPRRLAVGLEQNRLAMLLAVLHRHAGIACFDQDVFLNAVGGVKITEPAADLAVLLAIHSSMRNKPLPRGLVVFGEIGLAGEIRPTPRGQERLKEAAKLGFSIAVIPKSNAPKQAIDGLEVIAVERIEQAIDRVRGLEAA